MIFDGIAVILLILIVIGSVKRGFFSSVVSLLSNIALMVAVVFFSDDFNVLLKDTSIYTTISSKLTASLTSYITGQGDSSWVNYLIENLGFSSTPTAQLSTVLSDKIMYIISVILLIIIGLIIASVIQLIIRAITEATPLEGVDRFLALLFGIVSGGVVVGLITTVLILVSNIVPGASWLGDFLKGSYVVGLIKMLPFFK